MAQRQQLIVNLAALVTQNLSSEGLSSMASTLASVSQKSDEIQPAAAEAVLNAASSILSNAARAGVDYELLSNALQCADNVAGTTSGEAHLTQLLTTTGMYTSLTSSQLVGHQTVEHVFENFRMSTVSLPGIIHNADTITDSKVLFPQSELDKLLSSTTTAVFVSQNASAAVAVHVTVIESSGKLLGSDKPFMSNPVLIQISNLRGLNISNSTASSPEILISLKNTEPLLQLPQHNFTTVCKKNAMTFLFNYTCPISGYIIFHNCSSKVGSLRSFCPVFRPSCESFLSSGIQSHCKMVNFTTAATLCACSMKSNSHTNGVSGGRRSLSSSVQSVASDSGALQLIALSKLVASDFSDSFSSAASLTQPANIQRALLVILMFACLWSAGLALLTMCSIRRHRMQDTIAKEEKLLGRQHRAAQSAQSPAAVLQYVTQYVLETVPTVFRLKSRLHQLVRELKSNHRYLSLFLSAEEGPRADRNRLLKVAEVLTVQTLLMFLLALLYDLQSPADDGSCAAWINKEACLSRRSPLDSTQSYCSWSDEVISHDDMNAALTCNFRELQMSAKGVLVIALLVSAITALFLHPVEFLFDLLAAPTASYPKDNDSEEREVEKRRRLLSKVQPLSVTRRAPFSVAQAIATNTSSRSSTKHTNSGSSSSGHAIAGTETRTLPGPAAAAQLKARGALLLLASAHRASLSIKLELDGNVNNEDDECLFSINNSSDFLNSSPEELFNRLTCEITLQRRLLQPSDLIEFDRQWGLDPITSSVNSEALKQVISGSIASTQQQSLRRIEQLRLASDQHRGLELLQLLMLDLLGRDSPAARIFEQKAEEDFRRSQVVTSFSQMLAALALLLLNVFFAYYCVLYGFRQGLAWQRQYLSACVAQMFVEVFINESLEVVWMHFLVPSLVANEVQTACEQLLQVVQRLCECKYSCSEDQRLLLSAPSYLFVSRHVAAAHPHLLEAGVVQAFNSYLPGQMSQQWHTKSGSGSSRGRGCNIRCDSNSSRSGWVSVLWVALAAGFSLLQLLGTAPAHLQRMFVRSIQPFFVSAVVLAYYLVARSPLLIAGFAAGLAAVVGYCAVRYIQEGRLERNRIGLVEPLNAETAVSGLQHLYLQSQHLQLKKPEDGLVDKSQERDHKHLEGQDREEEEESEDMRETEIKVVVADSSAVSESSFSMSISSYYTHRNTQHSSSDTSDLFEVSAESSDSWSNSDDGILLRVI